MRIAIIGTRGIPNHYGGFEQCAQYLAVGLVKQGFEVIVYNGHTHPFKADNWNGVQIVHCYDPERTLRTAGQFIYDLNCILDSRKRKLDIVLQLGYTSNSLWGAFLPRNAIVTTNMDGLEWKRTKYSRNVRKYLLLAERLAVKHSKYLISDSIGIQDYLQDKYNRKSVFIPYGADSFETPNESVLKEYQLKAYDYDLLIARLEPENSIEIILDGVVASRKELPFLVIGKHTTSYGTLLKSKYAKYSNIKFVGGIYDINVLNNLRHFSKLYFHGHTVGGTNPSLLEAMASDSLICANDNPFNRHILGTDAFYFTNSNDVRNIIEQTEKHSFESIQMLNNNQEKISNTYRWENIIDQYAEHFRTIYALEK
jgi:glycosyltransferase involved in cell wall biosynthesis